MNMELEGKKVAVIGLGRSGLAMVQFLCRRRARVMATDQKSEAELGCRTLTSLRMLGVHLELGHHTPESLLGSDFILVSPGVPLSIEPIRRARAARIPILGEVEFAFRFLSGHIIGVTGSNGKTTVTKLIGAILARAGRCVHLGGNIGVPLTSLIDRVGETDYVVAELSSFQLETIDQFRPHIAVMTNISPDHLDRHATLGEYIHAKRRIFLNQTAADWAVLNADDPIVLEMMYETRAHPVLFSRRRELDEGVFVRGDEIICRWHDGERLLMRRAEVPLLGEHNVENVMAAVAVGLIIGLATEPMREAIRSFPGVEHRLERVTRINGVDYYNDSKATNVDSAMRALEAFPGDLIVIFGGRDKGSDFRPLRPLVAERVKHIILLGEASPRIARALRGAAPMTQVASMAEAVQCAHRLARAGDTVLLAPACASFDLFDDYEHRGRAFKEEVHKLVDLAGEPLQLEVPIEETNSVNEVKRS